MNRKERKLRAYKDFECSKESNPGERTRPRNSLPKMVIMQKRKKNSKKEVMHCETF